MQALAGVRLTLINPGPTAPYSGMLPGFVAGHYTRDELDIDLVRLARFSGARLINGAVTAIDATRRTITVPDRPAIEYDVASIDVGITSAMPDLPGFDDHGVPAKPLGAFAARWDAFRHAAEDPHIAIIGGGVAGAELALAMTHALRQMGNQPVVHLVDSATVLSHLGRAAQSKLLAEIDKSGITLLENTIVSQVQADGLVLEDGGFIRSDFTTGAAGALPHDWVAKIGVKTHDGYIAVDRMLQSSDPALFAAGDCAHMIHDPRPKAGVFAVRQAPVLFDNLRATLSGGALRPYRPQKDYLKLISLGQKSALAERFGTAKSGPLLWRLKDHIDQKFMRQFNDLPVMAPISLPRTRALGLQPEIGAKPMCGGCGAKVGRAALFDVIAGDGDDAAILQTGGVKQVISTDHLRAFVADPVLMTRIAAVHALGDIWAMGATPQAATVNVILPHMSPDLQRRTVQEISSAAAQVLTASGVQVAGGHTSLGAEMTIGFTLTGLCATPPVTLSGAKPGDALILTKPLGSGTIMAGDMQGKARGDDVMTALTVMQVGQGIASKLLQGAHAMTDVTGFGLAGHLSGICNASGVGAELTLDDIPYLAGAVALARSGVQSSLFADNQTGAGVITGPDDPRFDLLFDPQTAGGLLASVPQSDAKQLISQLKDAGVQAAIIGQITPGSPAINVV